MTDTLPSRVLTPAEAIALLAVLKYERFARTWHKYELASAREKLDAIREAHAIEVIDGLIEHLEGLA